MEDKYFTPKLEDIHIGYELEWKLEKSDYLRYHDESVYEWQKNIVTIEDFNGGEIDDYLSLTNPMCKLRVPYLTDEQVLQEGWVDGKKDGYQLERIHLFREGYEPYYMITIARIEPLQAMYVGEGKDINQFRTICKIVNLVPCNK